MTGTAGSVLSVASSPVHGFSKLPRQSIRLVTDHGVEGDAHAGRSMKHRFLMARWGRLPNTRQVHLIAAELLSSLRDSGHVVRPGDLGENVTTTGIQLEQLPLGTH